MGGVRDRRNKQGRNIRINKQNSLFIFFSFSIQVGRLYLCNIWRTPRFLGCQLQKRQEGRVTLHRRNKQSLQQTAATNKILCLQIFLLHVLCVIYVASMQLIRREERCRHTQRHKGTPLTPRYSCRRHAPLLAELRCATRGITPRQKR